MTDKIHKVITIRIYKRPITRQLSSWCIAISYLRDWYQPELILAVIMGDVSLCICGSSYSGIRRDPKGNEIVSQCW